MKSLYLILAATAVAVAIKPTRIEDDIMWYPLEDEEGVYISILGERRATPQDTKWRSHRRARHPLSYDPTDNQDPSFFHNIQDKMPSPRLPPAPQSQPFPSNPSEYPFSHIHNEVLDYKRPPGTNPINHPTTKLPSPLPPPLPGPIAPPPHRSSTNRPSPEADRLVFPGQTSRPATTPSSLLPTDPPTMSPCERKCPATPEFNPVCGSDAVTYSNAGRLKCARLCGKNVRLSHHGNCGRTSLVTPLLSNNRKWRF